MIELNNAKDKNLKCVKDDYLVFKSENECESYEWKYKSHVLGTDRILKIKVSDLEQYLDDLGDSGVKIKCSWYTTWILTPNGDLYGCGRGLQGQQGYDYEMISKSDVLTFTKRAENVKDFDCAMETTWYIDNNNDLYGCGMGNNGQQGSNYTNGIKLFTKRAENVKVVKCSDETTWYLDLDNNLYGCGSNEEGQQGANNTTNVKKFTKRAENVKDFACTKYATWYVDFDNNLYGCGYNYYYEQGSGNDDNVLKFTKRAENVKLVKCVERATWYLDLENNLYGCGVNISGNQGSNNTNNSVKTFTKRAENVKDFVCSDSTTWYIDNNNDLYGCGNGYYGQQGMGQLSSTFTENEVHVFTKRAENIKKVVCSTRTTWYIDRHNNLYGCGTMDCGQQGDGIGGLGLKVVDFTKRAENVKDVMCSMYTTWFLTENDELYGCGNNEYGQQGNGTKDNVLTFTQRELGE